MKSRPLLTATGFAALLACWLSLSRETRPSSSTPAQEPSARATRNEACDPAKCIQDILTTADGDAEALARLAAALPSSELPALLDAIAAAETDSAHVSLARLLLRQWARHAPAEAANWLAGAPAGRFPPSCFEEVIGEWAAQNVSAMLAWVGQLPASDSTSAALLSAGFEAASRQQATAAVTLAARLAPSPERDRLLGYSVLHWINEDLARAMTWIERVPDRALREDLLAKVAVELSVQNEARAAALLAASLAPGKTQESAFTQILQHWARAEPKDAADWATSSAAGDLQRLAVDSLLAVWGERDWLAAGEWVMRLPAGQTFDAAARSYAVVLQPGRPELARDFADSIGDELERASVLHELRKGPASVMR